MKLSNADLLKWIDLNIDSCQYGIECCSSENEFNYFYGKIEPLETVKNLLITNEEEWGAKSYFKYHRFLWSPIY